MTRHEIIGAALSLVQELLHAVIDRDEEAAKRLRRAAADMAAARAEKAAAERLMRK